MIDRATARGAVALVGNGGGDVVCTSEDGEVIFQWGLPSGKSPLEPLMPFMSATDTLSVEGPVSLFNLGGKRLRMDRPFRLVSGANPDFRPANPYSPEAEMRRMMLQLQKNQRFLERRERALAKARDAFKAEGMAKPLPKPEEPEVIEPVEKPAE